MSPLAALGRMVVPRGRTLATQAGADKIRALWRQTKAVCFDVDSTVCTEEGIDVLAASVGKGEEVAAWTRKAMGGSVPFHEALEARLKIMAPSRSDVENCLEETPPQLSPGIADLVGLLHARGVDVFLVSGGFRQMINPVADKLAIPRERIFANNLLFGDDGAFAGHDDKEPTAWAGGKAKVVGQLKEQGGYSTLFMIGDGATDLEARPPADAFIGFGGIVVRDVVRDNADWFVTDFEDLCKELRE